MSCSNCNKCECTKCCTPKTCKSNVVIYEGADLECLGISCGDTLESVINKVNEFICSVQDAAEPCTNCITYCGEGITCGVEDLAVTGDNLDQVLANICTIIDNIPVGGGETLAETLVIGNETDGSDIVVSPNDDIVLDDNFGGNGSSKIVWGTSGNYIETNIDSVSNEFAFFNDLDGFQFRTGGVGSYDKLEWRAGAAFTLQSWTAATIPSLVFSVGTFETGTISHDTLTAPRTWDFPDTSGKVFIGPAFNSLIDTPTATEDGYAVTWDNTAGEYTLSNVGGGGPTPYTEHSDITVSPSFNLTPGLIQKDYFLYGDLFLPRAVTLINNKGVGINFSIAQNVCNIPAVDMTVVPIVPIKFSGILDDGAQGVPLTGSILPDGTVTVAAFSATVLPNGNSITLFLPTYKYAQPISILPAPPAI